MVGDEDAFFFSYRYSPLVLFPFFPKGYRWKNASIVKTSLSVVPVK
jgi:hypothetical protein